MADPAHIAISSDDVATIIDPEGDRTQSAGKIERDELAPPRPQESV